MWRGDAIKAKMNAAARKGIDSTTSECVITAKSDHPWQNRTGTAEGSIRMEPAEETMAGKIQGRWGSFDTDYFVFLELGTSFMQPMPSLRPAADEHYPTLPQRIKEAWEES